MPDTSRFLRGPFAPIERELTNFDLPVVGQIPAELNGRYLRNGPNPMALDDPEKLPLVPGGRDGPRVGLQDGRAEWYRNRCVRSSRWPIVEASPARRPAARGMDFAPNTHVVATAAARWPRSEAGPRPYELSDELDTVWTM